MQQVAGLPCLLTQVDPTQQVAAGRFPQATVYPAAREALEEQELLDDVPKIRKADLDLKELGAEMAQRKEALMSEML
ncbi:hypothetical protein [Aquabacterium humicola]|uniref:hypothetical protein n=1 Tax=Aquabacterium humicola TaxID=3237377 RepID=UPI002543F4EA|nr:hypothetical protein [Rubrivivax pictus]